MADIISRFVQELHSAIERSQRPRNEFRVSPERDGWITVEYRGRQRHYPLTPEIGVLLAGDVRRGAFG